MRSTNAQPGPLIIGYGNPLRGDDAVGYLAAEQLRALVAGRNVEVLAVHQLTPELAEPISRAARVIFIDAALSGESGRSLVPDARALTHHCTPEALLALSLRLFGRAPEATLYSIPASSFELGAELTPEVAKSLQSLVDALAIELSCIETGEPGPSQGML
ncbi:MAG TPA: hydrogenase maturation protease [Bryobacteraceae bacterium]|nr:hydrogenase maturation protease [Bryobacteraceae bacterium]